VFTPISRDAEAWFADHLPKGCPRLGAGYAVQRRYVLPLLRGDGAAWIPPVAGAVNGRSHSSAHPASSLASILRPTPTPIRRERLDGRWRQHQARRPAPRLRPHLATSSALALQLLWVESEGAQRRGTAPTAGCPRQPGAGWNDAAGIVLHGDGLTLWKAVAVVNGATEAWAWRPRHIRPTDRRARAPHRPLHAARARPVPRLLAGVSMNRPPRPLALPGRRRRRPVP
jgi:hypothetical protein